MSAAKTGKFIDYSNQISNLIWALLIGIIITNVYIIQRSLHWNQIVKEKVGISLANDYSDPDYMTVFWETLQQEQSRFNGVQTTLRFNYGSLSLLWPVIILVIYIILYFLIKRHYSIAKTIVNIDAGFDKRIISKYPLFPLYGKNFTPAFFYIIVLFILPICAFAIHGFSGIKVTDDILQNVNEVVEKNQLSSDHAIHDLANSFRTFFKIQLITTIIVFIPLLFNNFSLFRLTRKEL